MGREAALLVQVESVERECISQTDEGEVCEEERKKKKESKERRGLHQE